MKIRELLLCAIDPRPAAPAPAAAQQGAIKTAQAAPAQMLPGMADKVRAADSIASGPLGRNDPLPTSGSYFSSKVGQPPIPLK